MSESSPLEKGKIPEDALKKVREIHATLDRVYANIGDDAIISLNQEIDRFDAHLFEAYPKKAPHSAFRVVLTGGNPESPNFLGMGMEWDDFTEKDSVEKFVGHLADKYLKEKK